MRKSRLQQQQNQRTECLVAQTKFSENFIGFSILVAVIVWTIWLILTGPSQAFSNLIANWEAALTMVFGSIVAGGTSMGGGAVAFPVFTKVLHVPPQEAKIFSLAIQSVGMSAATFAIVAMGTRVEWRFVRWASLGGVLGIIVGDVLLAPVLPPTFVKMFFTMVVSSFGVVLLALNRTKRRQKLDIFFWGKWERLFSLIVGLFGGIMGGLVGSGMDILCFSVMILLFNLSEKCSTPTSVILMAINAVAGFILHKFFIGDFVEPVLNYWLAAVPVVVVGAPAGAVICSLLNQKTVVRILHYLILIELFSSLLLIPLNFTLICFSMLVFALFCSIYYWVYLIGKKRSRLVQLTLK